MTDYVLVHGCPGEGAAWDPLGAHLPIQALDLPDHGSDAASATVEEHVAHVVAALERATDPVVLVGHSYGTWVAAHAAARVPHRVARLVLLAGLADVTGDTAAALVGFAQALESGTLGAEGAAQIAAQRWLGPTPPAEQVERIRALFVREGVVRLARQLRRAVTATARAPRSGVPTRLVAIADDVAVPRALSEELATHLGVPLEVWPGASHFPHWDDAASVARALAASS